MQVPRYWRSNAQRYRLQGSVCPTCGQPTFPPRPVCPQHTAQPLQTAGWIFAELAAPKLTLEPVSLKGK